MQIITCELCDIIFHTGKCVDALHRIADTKTMLSIIRISQSYHFERDFTSFPGLPNITILGTMFAMGLGYLRSISAQ